MRLLTYFVFTLLSVVIQFCVMDFIHRKVEINEKPISFQERAKNKKTSLGTFKERISNDHALYYRSNKNHDYKASQALSETKYLNLSLDLLSAVTTEPSFTVFDILYDEANTTTDAVFTDENFMTSTELDNVTDIALFENKTSTTARPNTVAKPTKDKHICYCNLLYNQCDINCCCDDDCSLADKTLFDKCENVNILYRYKNEQAKQLSCDETETGKSGGGFRNLFCIAKTNLPENSLVLKQKFNSAEVNNAFLWHENRQSDDYIKFNLDRQQVWLLKNRSLYYLDLPASVTNNYCSIRRPIIFLKNFNIQCEVKIKNLEMFRVVKTLDESSVISAFNSSSNSSAVNCTSSHCTDWIMSYCDQNNCSAYNESLHYPSCTENWCNNLALKLEYIFNIYDSKIVNASIKFYIQNVSTSLGAESYVTQEVAVKFFISNTSSEKLIKLSGNPGYMTGLPLITSFSDVNHTENFFSSSTENPYLSHADNVGGFCVLSRYIKKNVEFGINKRTKCRVNLTPVSTLNATEACIKIQSYLNEMLCVNRNMYISPYGNPDGVKDDEWLPIELKHVLIYGKLQKSKLQCFNLQTRVAFIFTYANSNPLGEYENKLLGATVEEFRKNISFSIQEPSTVITMDVNFVNVNKLTRPQLTEIPHLNLNLPKDFFFPFPSNKCYVHKRCLMLINFLYIIALLTK